MKRFRNARRRSAALMLLPVTALIISSNGTTASAAASKTGLQASHKQVGPNSSVTLSGHFTAPKAATTAETESKGAQDRSQRVRIQFRANGAKNWHDQDTTSTGKSGKFSERVAVTRSGRFRAVSSSGQKTPAEMVRVKSETQSRLGEKNPKVGDSVAIKGHVAPGGPGRKVAVKVGGDTLHTRTNKSGHFEVKWKAASAGDYAVHVKADGDRIAAGSGDKAGQVTVFRGAEASYYGPGFYGGALACGGTLQSDTIGVANKTLPCGTKLTLRYGNKEVEAKVIDRGPYSGTREFDLTEATKNKLGFPSTGTVLVNK
jgi:rare lipoprotein A